MNIAIIKVAFLILDSCMLVVDCRGVWIFCVGGYFCLVFRDFRLVKESLQNL